jgi:hypothetical protein
LSLTSSIRILVSFALGLSLTQTAPVRAQEKTAQAAPPAVAQTQSSQTGITIEHTREDFGSLSLAGSDLVPATPFPGGHESNKDFIRELYQVQWRSQDPIELFIIRPAGVKNPPVVLYLFSFPSDTDRFYNAAYCKHLVSNGTAAVGFISALTGDRFHRPMKEWFVSELQESLGSTVHDVQMILNYLESRHDLDMTRVGMFGQGSGGAIAILSAAADPRIKAIDVVGPWGDWPDFLAEAKGIPDAERPNYLKPEFLKKLETLEPARYLPDLKTRNVRIEFTDQELKTKWATNIEKAAPANAAIRNYTSPEGLHSASADGTLFQWLADRLKPPAETVAPAQSVPSTTADTKGTSR